MGKKDVKTCTLCEGEEEEEEEEEEKDERSKEAFMLHCLQLVEAS